MLLILLLQIPIVETMYPSRWLYCAEPESGKKKNLVEGQKIPREEKYINELKILKEASLKTYTQKPFW